MGLDPSTQFYWDPASGGNGHIYEFVRDNTLGYTFEQARSGAADREIAGISGYLVTITDSGEAAFIRLRDAGQSYWLGASDSAIEGRWSWVTGPEAGQLLTYSNWGAGEPNNLNNEDYAMVAGWLDGRWNDLAPNKNAYYIAEFYGAITINTPAVTATGVDFIQGRTLYANASVISDPDGLGLINWRWQRSTDGGSTWSDISSATADSYC